MTLQFRKLAGIGFFCAIACGAMSSPSRAGEDDFLARFTGSWSGAGTAIIDAHPVQVSCRIVGQPEANRITIAGSCHAAIFGQPISVDLTYDPASGRYSGIYIGDRVGPARVSGKRNGNAVDFTITWPKPVNGDTLAQMSIENAGKGVLKISVSDNQVPGGMIMRSDFILSQL
jgi:hypothetical protein